LRYAASALKLKIKPPKKNEASSEIAWRDDAALVKPEDVSLTNHRFADDSQPHFSLERIQKSIETAVSKLNAVGMKTPKETIDKAITRSNERLEQCKQLRDADMMCSADIIEAVGNVFCVSVFPSADVMHERIVAAIRELEVESNEHADSLRAVYGTSQPNAVVAIIGTATQAVLEARQNGQEVESRTLDELFELTMRQLTVVKAKYQKQPYVLEVLSMELSAIFRELRIYDDEAADQLTDLYNEATNKLQALEDQKELELAELKQASEKLESDKAELMKRLESMDGKERQLESEKELLKQQLESVHGEHQELEARMTQRLSSVDNEKEEVERHMREKLEAMDNDKKEFEAEMRKRLASIESEKKGLQEQLQRRRRWWWPFS